jgi:hypothetical protein
VITAIVLINAEKTALPDLESVFSIGSETAT